MAKVSASILSADFTRLRDEIEDVESAGVDFIHLDVMDGIFVPNLTFGPFIAKAVRSLTKLPLDAHLMIINPIKYVEEFRRAGCEYIVFHPEAKSPVSDTIERIKDVGAKPGLAINPETPLDMILPFLKDLKWVLVMSVNPGFAGQSFMSVSIPKLKRLMELKEKEGFDYIIAVDGGINSKTAPIVRDAGAEVLVSASFIFGAEDRKRAVELLKGESNTPSVSPLKG